MYKRQPFRLSFEICIFYLYTFVFYGNIMETRLIGKGNLNGQRRENEMLSLIHILLHSCHNVTRRQFDEGVTYLELMEQNVINLRKGLDE